MENFTELNLNEPILRAITELGYTKPSPIQAQTLPILLNETTDFLGLAATGTGKTAAFTIPLLQKLDSTKPGVQALILCPTRELVIQVAGQIGLIGKYKNIRALPIYGGTGYGDQLSGLRRGAPIVVGTPGRVVDHINKGTLKIDGIKVLILDEADEMISMGFKEDLEFVLSHMPKGQSNTWLFSATMGSDIRRVADTYLDQPRQVQVNRAEVLPGTVEQIYYATQESNKPEVLCKLIDAAEGFYGIIFCQTKALVADVTQYLKGRGYQADCLHGDMDQNARERTMRAFREKKFTILVATDVACRGLDVNDISHVVNYSIPRELDNYVHRIGRTGRIGKSGLAFSLVTPSHRGLIGRIERMTRTKFKEGKIPTRRELAVKKIAQSLSSFASQQSPARAVELLDESWKKSIADMSKEEIAGRFLSLLHPEVFSERAEPEAKPAAWPSNAEKRSESRPSGGGQRSERRFEGRPERRFEPRPTRYGDKHERRPESHDDRGYGRKADSGGGHGYVRRPRPEGLHPPGPHARDERRGGMGKPRTWKKQRPNPSAHSPSSPAALP